MAVQNVNKGFVYVTDFTASLRFGQQRKKIIFAIIQSMNNWIFTSVQWYKEHAQNNIYSNNHCLKIFGSFYKSDGHFA